MFLLALLGPRIRLLAEVRSGASLRALAIQSAFNCILPWILIAHAMRQIDAGLATIASAIFSTGLAMVVYFKLLATVGSIAMSSQAYLRILVGVGLGIAFLGERPTASMWIGLCLVVAGVIAMTLPARKAHY